MFEETFEIKNERERLVFIFLKYINHEDIVIIVVFLPDPAYCWTNN